MLQFCGETPSAIGVDQFVPLHGRTHSPRGRRLNGRERVLRTAFAGLALDSAAAFTDDVTGLLDRAPGTRTLVLVGLGAALTRSKADSADRRAPHCLGEVRNVGDLLLAVPMTTRCYITNGGARKPSRAGITCAGHFRPIGRVELIRSCPKPCPDDPAARKEIAAEAELTGSHFALT